MNNDITRHYHLKNLLHTFLLLAGMLLLLSLIGWLIAGYIGILWALGMGSILLMTIQGISSHFILYLYRARPLASDQLTDIINWLTIQSHLPYPPKLYYIPSRAMLAFSVGMKKDKAIAISDGLLQVLNTREIIAVLAHEMSHIQSKDLWVMATAEVLNRLTSLMALFGYLMLLFYLPVLMLQKESIPWLLFLTLILAPNLSALMQLALSRTREFNADTQAVTLTGDPAGLISALIKIENHQNHWLKHLLLPGLRAPQPSLLRTHPLTKERIRHLQEITQQKPHFF